MLVTIQNVTLTGPLVVDSAGRATAQLTADTANGPTISNENFDVGAWKQLDLRRTRCKRGRISRTVTGNRERGSSATTSLRARRPTSSSRARVRVTAGRDA